MSNLNSTGGNNFSYNQNPSNMGTLYGNSYTTGTGYPYANSAYSRAYMYDPSIQYVTSRDEALSRSRFLNTESVYFHQDLPIFYRIKVDGEGKKFWQEFTYSVNVPSENETPVTKADMSELIDRLKRVEERVFQTEESEVEK